VLTVLFLVQRHGTGGIGKFFGPITAAWFVVIAVLGLVHIVQRPSVIQALSPHHALYFLFANPRIAFIALGFVVLCVTGAEALYADMGHFGKRPIRVAWFGLVMPSLVLNYFGQGAMLLEAPEKAINPFYGMAPDWALYPLIALATIAAVIASQALISARSPSPSRRSSSATCRDCASCTRRCARPGRSTCRWSTGACTPAS
jgi:KUP system potassium uptake protein